MLGSGRWTQSRVVDNLSSFESESWKHPSKFESGHDRRQEYLHTYKDVSDRVIVKTRFPHAHTLSEKKGERLEGPVLFLNTLLEGVHEKFHFGGEYLLG